MPKKNSFLIYADNYTAAISKLSFEQKGKLFDAIFSKAGAVDAIEPELDLLLEMAFNPISASMDRNQEKYDRICERNKNNGQKGGRPKTINPEPKKPSGFTGNPKNPDEPDSDSDSDSDSGSDRRKPSASVEAESKNPEEKSYKTKRKRKLSGKQLETFLRFWESFGYRKGKAEAADAWLDIPNLTDELIDDICRFASAEAATRPSLISSGRTPKMAQGWITGKRWEDEAGLEVIPQQGPKNGNKIIEPRNAREAAAFQNDLFAKKMLRKRGLRHGETEDRNRMGCNDVLELPVYRDGKVK